jgi:peptidoglycan hydrolase CwlO-like protein
MAAAGNRCRAAGRRIELPPRILADPDHGIAAVPAEYDVQRLFASNPAFQLWEVRALQAELSQAVTRLNQLPAELQKLKQYVLELIALNDEIRQRVDRRNARIQDLRTKLLKTREKLAAALDRRK